MARIGLKSARVFLSQSAEVECSPVPEVGTAASQIQKEPANYIRGQAFHSITDAAASLLGPSIRTEMLASLSEPLKRALQYGSLVRSGWFPIEWHAELHRAFARLESGPKRVPSIHKRIGAISAEADITSVYRFILSLGTPHFILAQLGRILGTFIKTSEFKVLRKDARAVDVWVNIPGATPELWEDVAGSAETILRLTGTKEPLVTWKSSSAHPGQAEFYTSWT